MFRFKYHFISHITRGIRNTHLLAARDKHFISIQQYVPAMQPGKRSTLAFCQSDSLIQLPSWLFTPPAGMGMVSLWLLVTITVLLSTRATSFGSVRANQLKNNRVGFTKEIQSFGGLKTIHQRMHVFVQALTSSHIWEASWPSPPSPDLPGCLLSPPASPSPRAHWRAYIHPLPPSQNRPPQGAAREWRPGTEPQHSPQHHHVWKTTGFKWELCLPFIYDQEKMETRLNENEVTCVWHDMLFFQTQPSLPFLKDYTQKSLEQHFECPVAELGVTPHKWNRLTDPVIYDSLLKLFKFFL